MAEVSQEGYVLAEVQGEMYFCNARCLCLWAVHFVTSSHRPEEQKRIACELTMPPMKLARNLAASLGGRRLDSTGLLVLMEGDLRNVCSRNDEINTCRRWLFRLRFARSPQNYGVQSSLLGY